MGQFYACRSESDAAASRKPKPKISPTKRRWAYANACVSFSPASRAPPHPTRNPVVRLSLPAISYGNFIYLFVSFCLSKAQRITDYSRRPFCGFLSSSDALALIYIAGFFIRHSPFDFIPHAFRSARARKPNVFTIFHLTLQHLGRNLLRNTFQNVEQNDLCGRNLQWGARGRRKSKKLSVS